MNVNLFMGLNIKKSCPLPAADAQISKAAKDNEPVYDKFKDIMGNIKKMELAQNNKRIKNPAGDSKSSEINDCAGADEVLGKNEINGNMKFDNDESKSLSLKRLKNIDEKMYELISFIILANSPDAEKLDNFTIRIKDGQVIAAAGDKEIIINSSFFGSLAENITASLEQSMKSISAYFEDGMTQSGKLSGSKTIKDVLTEAIFNALDKTSGSREIPGGPPGKNGVALQQESSKTLEFNSGIDVPLVYADKNSNVNQNGRIVSLEQALHRLFSQLDIPEDFIDSKIDSVAGGLKPDSEELELGKQSFLNPAKKITVELSRLSKIFTANLEEMMAKIQTGSSGKFELSNHMGKSLRNTEAFEFYTDKFLKPFVFQAAGDAGISNSGAVSSNPVIEKTAVNLADVIMQISSKIITKDGPVLRQLEIMLRPESLGAIRIKVESAGDGVNIKIQTQYSHTEEIISSNLDMLKNNLSEKGVLLKDLSVFMDLNTGKQEKSFEGFSGFGNEFNRGNGPKQHPETDAIIKNDTFKDLSETGKTGNTDIDAFSNEYKDTYGVDIVA